MIILNYYIQKTKLKISNDNIYININNGIDSFLSPILFINDIIKKLIHNSYKILSYDDDLCVLCEKINYY